MKTGHGSHFFPGGMAAIALGALVFGLCSSGAPAEDPPHGESIKVTSPAFESGQPIPAEFTCAGGDQSPMLQWSGAPAGAKSFALICEDPDAPSGTWTHWVLYNLPAGTAALSEKTATSETLPNGALQGVNDFHRVGYSGPCPPPGKAHRYFFKVYALDTMLALKPRATRQELLHAMEGHILTDGQLTGTYQKK